MARDNRQPVEDGTWHHGLVARYWAEFNQAEPDELAWYRGVIQRFGEPALDVACGAGRLLLPLLASGLDVDGTDISADMLAECERLAARRGLRPRLLRQAMHDLEPGRTYRTIYCCDSFGIGGNRANDLEALRRIHDALADGGAFAFSVELPFSALGPAGWAHWLPGRRDGLPEPWPENDARRRATDGNEFELSSRLAELDPLVPRRVIEIRARLWRQNRLVAEEFGRLGENLYFVPELRLMLQTAGFGEVSVEGRYNSRPATANDGTVVFVARR